MHESTQQDASTRAWPGGIAAITVFVEDLAAAKRFYSDVFQLPLHFEDDNSAVFKFGDTLVNLLKTSEASELVAPAPVATPARGSDSNSRSASMTWTRWLTRWSAGESNC